MQNTLKRLLMLARWEVVDEANAAAITSGTVYWRCRYTVPVPVERTMLTTCETRALGLFEQSDEDTGL
jgi:hypothetical protein